MPIDPTQTYVLLSADGSAAQLPGGEAFWSRPESELDRFGHDWLVSEFECSTDWPNWEMHPHADELESPARLNNRRPSPSRPSPTESFDTVPHSHYYQATP